MAEALLKVENLSVNIASAGADVVSGAHFTLSGSEIFGLVGESGCGKTLTALAVAGLLPEAAGISGGRIIFDGRDTTHISARERQSILGKDLSMVFQEPMTSLDPLMKIGRQVSESLRLHKRLSRTQIHERTLQALQTAGLADTEDLIDRYPHELSGGMRQRVMIAAAIISGPKLIIADEPTTALDVTVQSRILALLKRVNRETGCALLFISHDLGIVRGFCDKTAVMYAGKIVEYGLTEEIFTNPSHEYTKQLLDAIPSRDKKDGRLAVIPGRVPPAGEKRAACPFAPRCRAAHSECFVQVPRRVAVSPTHTAYCVNAQGEGGVSDE